jgi:hypothetical protein
MTTIQLFASQDPTRAKETKHPSLNSLHPARKEAGQLSESPFTAPLSHDHHGRREETPSLQPTIITRKREDTIIDMHVCIYHIDMKKKRKLTKTPQKIYILS